MQIQKINTQKAFGARSLTIENDVLGMGDNIVKKVFEAAPELLKIGDDYTELTVKNGINFFDDNLPIAVEAKKIISMVIKVCRKAQNVNGPVSDYVSCEPKSAEDIIKTAKSAVEKMEYKVKILSK